MSDIILPTEKKQPVAINPNTLLIYAPPKMGKTTIISQLENSLLLELEKGGADFVNACYLNIEKPSDFNKTLEAIEKSEHKYDYLCIDTLSKLDEWSEIVGTYNYMQKQQGKKFNRDEMGVMILHTDNRFESCHEMPNGSGYQHSRNQMIDWYERIIKLAKHVVFIAHIKDKMIESKSGDSVEVSEINLTGKVKSIITSRVDAVGYLRRKGKQAFLSFDNEYKTISGGRCKHLQGEILISEKMEDNSIKTYWENIFLKTK
jgi:hypothetical protein